MRLLVPATSAALITTLLTAAALSANAAVPTFVPTAGTPSSSASSAPAGTTQARSQEPTLPGAVTATVTPTLTPTLTGTNTAAADTARVAPHGSFSWPLSPRPTVLRRFEQPVTQWSPGHRGVDLLAAVGQPVLSAGDGVVVFSGVIAGRGVITVGHAGGLRTTYEPVDERLTSGTVVPRGAPIGVVSPTPGHCAPRTCLHWGAISGTTYRDPLSLLGFGHPILLPLD